MNIEALAQRIAGLSMRDRLKLNERLRQLDGLDDEGGLGVREPGPRPKSPQPAAKATP